jgi:hypothetical protein
LVCLGVVRRMLHSWKSGGTEVKLSSRQLLDISEKLVYLRRCTPSDFARRPRSLCKLDRWKATECRQVLLYTRPCCFETYYTSSDVSTLTKPVNSNWHFADCRFRKTICSFGLCSKVAALLCRKTASDYTEVRLLFTMFTVSCIWVTTLSTLRRA